MPGPSDAQPLRYTPTHEWVRRDADDTVTVGLSKFAVEQLTDLILIDLSRCTPGQALTKGKPFGEVESVKAVADLYAPISGTVVEVNPRVVADVQLLATDPTGAGWLLKLTPSDPGELDTLLDETAYRREIDASPH